MSECAYECVKCGWGPTVPLAYLRVVHEGCNDAPCPPLPLHAVHHGNMLGVSPATT